MSAIELDEGGVVSAFLDAGEEIDDSIEEELVHHAQEFFEENGVAIVTTLFHASLPEAYLARRGVQVLDLTGELVSNWTQRIRETGQFLVSVLSSEGEPDTIGTTTLHHGQFAGAGRASDALRHAAVRWLLDAPYRPELPLLALEGLEAPAPWQVRMAQIGEVRVPSAPLNQEDLLGTLSTFTTVTFMALEKLAVSFDDDDRRAFHHLWNIIGWHLGIGDAESVGDIPVGSRPTWPHNRVLPLEFDEMDDLAHRLAARLQGPSDAGARLAKTLVQELAYPLPNRAHGAPDFLVRYMVGDAQADALQLGAGGYAAAPRAPIRCARGSRGRARATRLARLGDSQGVRGDHAVRAAGVRVAVAWHCERVQHRAPHREPLGCADGLRDTTAVALLRLRFFVQYEGAARSRMRTRVRVVSSIAAPRLILAPATVAVAAASPSRRRSTSRVAARWARSAGSSGMTSSAPSTDASKRAAVSSASSRLRHIADSRTVCHNWGGLPNRSQ